jgi:hypothetical protein
MNADGPKFKAYVDQQRLSKVKLADALGMTKQNLFSLFKSKEFQKETKQKIEKALNITWDMVNRVNIDPVDIIAGPTINNPDPMSQDYREKFYQLLEKNSKLEEKIERIESNLALLPKSMEALTDLVLKGQDQVARKLEDGLNQNLKDFSAKIDSLPLNVPGKKQVSKGKH